MADVKKVEWQGGIYNIADETAHGEAQQARALANTAQSTAERALTAAGNAQNVAETAQDTANDAQITADTAKNTADDISAQFSDYKKLESVTVPFDTQGTVTFRKRGNVCEIYVVEIDSAAGVYTVSIPAGFTPLWGTWEGGLPLTWGGVSYGYWKVVGDTVTIYVATAHSISATHVFLM